MAATIHDRNGYVRRADCELSSSGVRNGNDDLNRLDFDPLSLQTLKAKGSQLQRLVQSGGSFGEAITECGKAYPGLNYHLNEIAQARRTHTLSNTSADGVQGIIYLP